MYIIILLFVISNEMKDRCTVLRAYLHVLKYGLFQFYSALNTYGTYLNIEYWLFYVVNYYVR